LFRLRNLVVCLAVLVPLLPITAQENSEFLPEVDVYYRLQPAVGFWFQAKQTREAGDPVQAEIGPSLNLYLLKPIWNLNPPQSQPIVFSIGYRYLPSPNAPPTNRMEPVVTLNLALKHRFLISDRNRADLDWQSGSFNWRYRNRLNVGTRLHIRGYEPQPYVAVEVFYASQYAKWDDTAIYVGCQFPIGTHVNLEPYYEHQNITSKSPNQRYNQAGLILNLSF
jgi:uncharacterized protein DUF2490